MTDEATGGGTAPPPAKRFQFKKTLKPRKKKEESADALDLFDHSKTSFSRIAEEKRRHAEEEKRKKKLAEEEKLRKKLAEEELQPAANEGGSAWKKNNRSHGHSMRSPDTDGFGLTSSSPTGKVSRKRRSDTFDEDSDYSPSRVPLMSSALTGSTRTKAMRVSPGKPSAIADLEESDNSLEDWLKSPKKPKLPKPPLRPRRGEQLPTPTTPIISIDDSDDPDDNVLAANLSKNKAAQEQKEPKPSEERDDDDELAGMDPDLLRFIEEGKKRREASKAGVQTAIVRAFVVSNIPNTNEMVAQLRLNQETKVLRKVWAYKNDIKLEDVFLTWRGGRVYDSTNCQVLGITANEEDREAVLEDGTHSSNGFREGGVLFEAWTEELFEEYEKEKDHARRQLRGEFSDRDFFGEEEKEEAPVPKIRITLRAKEGEPVKASVRPATTVGELVALFRASRKLGEDQAVKINFDGDILEDPQTIEELEIEDKDELHVTLPSS